MKKQLFLIGLMAMSMSFTACNKDDNNNNGNGNGNTIPEGTADVTGSSSVNGLKSGFSDGCCHQLQFPFLFSLHSLSLHNRIDKQVTNGRQLHV